MKKSLFEQLGGTYHQEGDYLIPDLILTTEENHPIGVGTVNSIRMNDPK